MAKKIINENCPLSGECGKKKCDYHFKESDCAYYKANSRPDVGGEEMLPILDGIFDDDKNIMVYLDTDKLLPHPDNPRKDLGDLEELANSIKANGVMQNLTVIPNYENDDTYTVIIGHRRLAAAKLAGLDEVPCVIVDMTPQEQLATMLLENIQRTDLTPYEQAQGFQLMINFGESVESISAKTGFSQSTVRRRIKLAELDQNKLKNVSEKQISLKDLERLNDIEDVNERNRCLDYIGTNNFDYTLKQALSEQERKKQIQKWREYMTSLGATELTDTDGYEEIAFKQVNDYESREALAEMMEEGTEYFFDISYSYVNLLVKEEDIEDSEEDKESEKEKEQKRAREKDLEERRAKLQEAFKNAYQLRRKFIFDYTEAEAKSNIKAIIEFAINLTWTDSYISQSYNWNGVNELLLLGLDIKKGAYISRLPYDGIKPVVDNTPFKALLTHIYGTFSDDAISCGYYNAEYHKSDRLEFIYRHLCALGYEMSDEEKALLKGTSELYLPKTGK